MMTYGIHLPQYGRVASGAAVSRAARHAEELGFRDVWVSDHIVHPAEQTYPSPFLLDPFATLSWAAARHHPGPARHERDRRAAAQPRLVGQSPRDRRRDERRAPDRRGRDRLEQARVRRPRSVLREPGPAHGRDPRSAACRMDRRPRDVRRCRVPPRGDPLPPQARRSRSRSGSAAGSRRRSGARSPRATASTSWA